MPQLFDLSLLYFKISPFQTFSISNCPVKKVSSEIIEDNSHKVLFIFTQLVYFISLIFFYVKTIPFVFYILHLLKGFNFEIVYF